MCVWRRGAPHPCTAVESDDTGSSLHSNAGTSRDPNAVRHSVLLCTEISLAVLAAGGKLLPAFACLLAPSKWGSCPSLGRRHRAAFHSIHCLLSTHSGWLPKTVVSAHVLRTAWCLEIERGLRETRHAWPHRIRRHRHRHPSPSHGPDHSAVCLRDVMYFCCFSFRLQSSTPPATASDSHRQPSSAVMTSSPRSCSPAALGGRIC